MSSNKAQHNRMSPEKEREHEELLVRMTRNADEIRFVKGQQWRTLYYAILFLAATTLAFQQPINLGSLYVWAKLVGYAAVFVVTTASVIHLLTIKYNLGIYGTATASIEEELENLTAISSRLSRATEPKLRKLRNETPLALRWLPIILSDPKAQVKLYSGIFYALFIVIILLTGLASFFMILFDD
jgi:hypothetical protein